MWLFVVTMALSLQVGNDSDSFDYLETLLKQAHAAGAPTESQPQVNPIEVLPDAATEVPDYLKLEQLWQTGPYCGPVSLCFLLRLHGKEVKYEEVVKEFEMTEKGVSLADIQRVAGRFGLRTRVVSMVPEQVADLPRPAIVHWDAQGSDGLAKGHFDVLVHHKEGTGFVLIDTSNCVLVSRNYKELLPKLSGYSLIVETPTSYLALTLTCVVLGVVNLGVVTAWLWRRSLWRRSTGASRGVESPSSS